MFKGGRTMQFEINDDMGMRFKAALKKSGEDEKKVLERMFKTYVYDVFSREVETYYALETFMRMPKK
jgi:hypothetical protein